MWRPWLIAAAAAAVLLAIVLRVPEPPVPSAAAEVSTEFFEIGPVVGDVTDAYIVRVRVPRATMASFGLPVNTEAPDQRIEADLLVGTDGAARAIRFVHGIQ
jgi:hypothetical protein